MSPPVTKPTVVTKGDVEAHVIDLLQNGRLDYYLSQLNYPAPRGYAITQVFDLWPEDQLPTIIVACPGLVEPPMMDGAKVWRAKWDTWIGCMCSARNEGEARQAAGTYAAFIRAIMLQQASLNWNLGRGVRWLDEQYDVLPVEDRRTLAAVQVRFAVEVGSVVDGRELPLVPGGPLPTPGAGTVGDASHVIVTVDEKED